MVPIPKLTAREAFLEAFLHGEHVLLGRRLRPFCLRHWLLLDAMESPLLRGGPVEIGDLQLAALVCSTGNDEALRSNTLRERLWRRLTRLSSVAPWLPKWEDYLADYLPLFPLLDAPDRSVTKTPPFLVCAARLLGSFSREEILSMPLGELLAWGMAKSEAEGHSLDRLMSDFDIEGLKIAAQMLAEEAARRAR